MSRITPAASAKKTKSAHKQKTLAKELLSYFWLAVPMILILIFAIVYFFNHNKASCIGINAKNHCFAAEIVDTDPARTQGLSGRDSLAENSAMVFVFDRPRQQCFWMKEMRFAIDMVFLSSDKRINKIDRSVEPSTYPDTFCSDNTQYVVELNGGTSEALGLKVGDQISW